MKIKTDPDGLVFIKSQTQEAIDMNSVKCKPIEEIAEPILLDAHYLFEHQIIKSELDTENEDFSEMFDSKIDEDDLSHEIDIKFDVNTDLSLEIDVKCENEDLSHEIDINYDKENSSHGNDSNIEPHRVLENEEVSDLEHNLNIISNIKQSSQRKCYANSKKLKMQSYEPKKIYEEMKTSIDSNELTGDKSTIIQCKFCDETFENRKNMLQHQRKRCILNVYRRPQKTNTNKKSKAAKNTKTNECKYCAKTFAKRYNARQHEMYVCNMNAKKITLSSNNKPYNCRYCSKRFVNQFNVNRHENDTCKRNLKCTAIKNSYLKSNHELYICDYCKSSYTHKGYFRSHIMKHMGCREMYNCDFCTKSYTKRYNLKCHVSSNHMKSKLYSCNYCKRKFGWRWAVKQHEKKYHSAMNKMDMCD